MCILCALSKNIQQPLIVRVYNKDHKEKIGFQDLNFSVVNWPNSEFYGAIVCIMRNFG